MLKRLLTVLFLGSFLLQAYDLSDSLWNKIQNSKGIEKINARLEYSYIHRQKNYERSLHQAELALEEIRANHNDKNLEARAIYYVALPIYYNHQYERALKLFYQSLTLNKTVNDHSLFADLYFFIGNVHYFYYGDNDQTMKYYNLSIKEGLISDNFRILGATYSSMANIYRRGGSYEKALELNYKSKENYKKGNFKEGMAWSSYTLGSLYYTVGLLEESRKLFNEALTEYRIMANLDSNNTGIAMCLDQLTKINSDMGNDKLAKKYNQEALDIYKSQNSYFGSSVALRLKADLEYKSENYETALSILDSSLAIKKELNDVIGFASVYESYGLVLIAMKKYESAKDSLKKGLAYAKHHNQTKNIIKIDKHLSIIYNILGDYKKALYYKDREATVADSIYSSKITKNMLELENLYEIESKESMIKDLEKENMIKEESLKRESIIRRLLILILFFALIIIVLFIYFFTEKQRANRILADSKKHVDEVNATRDKFFSIIAHDLRAPFNSILGLTNILIEKGNEFNKEKTNELITAIHHSTKLSYDLLNNLLEWSRSQTNSITYVPEDLDIDSLIHSIKDLMSNNAEAKDLELKVHPHRGMIFADMNMLHTILRNLVSNAIKYSKPGSNIDIDYTNNNSGIVFSIKDHGVGMTQENMDRLFRVDDPYYSEGTAGEKGTGLGLIITKEFIEKHHGKIWVTSTPGRGSTFQFSIPK